jgi:hypothetical protein
MMSWSRFVLVAAAVLMASQYGCAFVANTSSRPNPCCWLAGIGEGADRSAFPMVDADGLDVTLGPVERG